jgi:hypothetical protein
MLKKDTITTNGENTFVRSFNSGLINGSNTFKENTPENFNLSTSLGLPSMYAGKTLGSAVEIIHEYNQQLPKYLSHMRRIFFSGKDAQKQAQALELLAFSNYIINPENLQTYYSNEIDSLRTNHQIPERLLTKSMRDISIVLEDELLKNPDVAKELIRARETMQGILGKLNTEYAGSILLFRSNLDTVFELCDSEIKRGKIAFPYAADLLSNTVLTEENLRKSDKKDELLMNSFSSMSTANLFGNNYK